MCIRDRDAGAAGDPPRVPRHARQKLRRHLPRGIPPGVPQEPRRRGVLLGRALVQRELREERRRDDAGRRPARRADPERERLGGAAQGRRHPPHRRARHGVQGRDGASPREAARVLKRAPRAGRAGERRMTKRGRDGWRRADEPRVHEKERRRERGREASADDPSNVDETDAFSSFQRPARAPIDASSIPEPGIFRRRASHRTRAREMMMLLIALFSVAPLPHPRRFARSYAASPTPPLLARRYPSRAFLKRSADHDTPTMRHAKPA